MAPAVATSAASPSTAAETSSGPLIASARCASSAAREALRADGPEAVAALSAELLAEAGEAVGERADGGGGVLALRAQP